MVDESDGVMYSVEAARCNGLRLLHGQETLLIPDPDPDIEGLWRSVEGLLGCAAVRSQCLLMKRGMSLNALKRCILICALDNLMRDIERIQWAVMVSCWSPKSVSREAMGRRSACASTELVQESSCCIRPCMYCMPDCDERHLFRSSMNCVADTKTCCACIKIDQPSESAEKCGYGVVN